MNRRVLLGGAGAALLGLSGCALVPPGAPAPSPTPDAASATPDPGRSAVVGVHEALAAAHAVEQDPGRVALLAWALAVSEEQGAATRTPLPAVAPRTPAPTPDPTPAPPSPEVTGRVRDALASAVGVYRTRAVDPATAQPLVWASMAAWATALTAALDRPGPVLEPRHDRLPHPVQTVAEADQAAALAVREVLYGVQVAGGASGLAPADLDRIRARVVVWTQLRDDLHRSLGPTPSASPTPGPAWFQVPRPPDAAAASALVVRLESAALPILGRSLAFGSDLVRARLVRALDDIATDLPTWGGPLVRWPGWPDAG